MLGAIQMPETHPASFSGIAPFTKWLVGSSYGRWRVWLSLCNLAVLTPPCSDKGTAARGGSDGVWSPATTAAFQGLAVCLPASGLTGKSLSL